jgi:alginate O-acetyltransferase complex protein AlgJ
LLESQARIERDGKVTYGRDGWLFLAEDSNDVFAQHCGTRRLSADDLERWVELAARRNELLAEHDCGYVLVIVPDSHSVYPEKLPPGTTHSPERPVHQLLAALREAATPARVLYPLEEMEAAKAAGLVCSRVDSHWTDFGAFVAYQRLMDELASLLPARRLTLHELAFLEMVGSGDLGNKLVPARLAMQPVTVFRYPEAKTVYDNCVENTGSVVVTECRSAPPTSCLLLGDSYSYSILKYLAESFGRLTFAHSARLDRRLLESARPDVVVNLMAERFVVEVPDDNGPGLDSYERAKRLERRTRPPVNFWTIGRWPSPVVAERLRAHFLEAGNLRDATIVSVLAYAGLLPRELTTLRWSDVGERELRIRRPGRRRFGDTPASRAVRLIEPLAEDLRVWRRVCGAQPSRSPVFPGRDPFWAGGEWATWSMETFQPAVEACKLELDAPHDLRHVFCTLLVHEGLSAREIGRRAGEKRRVIKTLYRYLLTDAKVWEPIDSSDLVREARDRQESFGAVATPI